MDPQLQQDVLGLGSEMDPQVAQVKRQQAMANALRQKAMAPMEGTQAGRIYKAPGIANLAANMYAGYKSQQMQPGIDQQMGTINQKQIGTKQRYLDALQMALRRAPPQAGTNVLAPDGMEDR